ncbi:MAG: hypothetical protein HZB40_07260 [Rhodocyclales bacterium]|nr:hypothetical protein [Rhodocyclales bacterium]
MDLTANVKAALLLSQSIYWTRHGRDIAQTGGWFLKTTEQWQMETGLSAREQSAAREVLRELAILNEQRVGIPARLHFRLCVDQLGALLSDHIGRVSGPLDWADGAAVAELLGPSLAYHRRLAGIGGGVHAGLLLSRALHLTRLRVRRQLREWIGNSADVWTEQIGLTHYEQEIARRNLADAGVWEETRVGTPRRLFARIRLDCLLARLAGDESGDANRIVLPYSPECGVATINTRQKGETSMRDSHIHVSTKMPIQFRQYRPYSFDKTANLHIQGSTRRSQRRGGDLILPESLLPEERAAALLLLKPCAQQAQALLDELSARMQAKAVHTSPLAYLRGLVRRALAGEFVPELGQRVAAARRRQAEELILRQQREAEEQRLAAECTTPEHQARLASRRAEMRQIADAMQAGRPPEKRS